MSSLLRAAARPLRSLLHSSRSSRSPARRPLPQMIHLQRSRGSRSSTARSLHPRTIPLQPTRMALQLQQQQSPLGSSMRTLLRSRKLQPAPHSRQTARLLMARCAGLELNNGFVAQGQTLGLWRAMHCLPHTQPCSLVSGPVLGASACLLAPMLRMSAQDGIDVAGIMQRVAADADNGSQGPPEADVKPADAGAFQLYLDAWRACHAAWRAPAVGIHAAAQLTASASADLQGRCKRDMRSTFAPACIWRLLAAELDPSSGPP